MMAYELREGQGSLFKNNRKTEDRHPDYTGSIKLPNGDEHWFSAWIKQGNQGGKFLSVQIGKSKVQDHQQERVPGSAKTPVDLEDEVPF